MAWSDAARAAALEARRKHQAAAPSGIHRPVAWYHGGPTALRGSTVKKSHSIDVDGKRVKVAFATTSIRQAIVYAGQSGDRPGSVYKVSPGSAKTFFHRDPIGGKALHVGVRGRMQVTGRVGA